MREDSLGDVFAGGRVLIDFALVEAEGGPAGMGASFLRRGAEGRRTRRSCEGIEKKP